MSRNPQFESLAKELSELHDRKNEDYSGNCGHYFNFEFATDFAKHFTNPIDKTFATIIGIKYARLIVLTSGTKKPNNESVEDTRKDIANYGMIWAAYYQNLPVVEQAVCDAIHVTDMLMEGLGHEVSEECLPAPKLNGILGLPILDPTNVPLETRMLVSVDGWNSREVDDFCRSFNGVHLPTHSMIEFTYYTQALIRSMKFNGKPLSLWYRV